MAWGIAGQTPELDCTLPKNNMSTPAPKALNSQLLGAEQTDPKGPNKNSKALVLNTPLPIGSIVVPFWDYLIGKYEPQKGTTMEPLGKHP